jgi:hypothetical protein
MNIYVCHIDTRRGSLQLTFVVTLLQNLGSCSSVETVEANSHIVPYSIEKYLHLLICSRMRIFVLPLLIVGQSLVCIGCHGSESATTNSVSRTRRRAASAVFYPTVQDIEDYLNGNHRATSSISFVKPTSLLDEEGKKWQKHVFSMVTDPPSQSPILPPPPCNNNLSRSDAILEILRSVTPEPTLLNTVTPQGMAYSWLVSEDPAATTTLINPCDHMMQIQQRYALAVLYYSTSGDSWTNRKGWLTFDDECTWAKVTCHADEPSVGALYLCKLSTYAICLSLRHTRITHNVYTLIFCCFFSEQQFNRRSATRNQSF